MISRRAFIAGACALCAAGAHAEEDEGCWRPDADLTGVDALYSYSDNGEKIDLTSGDPVMDRAFSFTLLRLSEDFKVYPGFGYRPSIPNTPAYSTARNSMHHADGTVVFSRAALPGLRAAFSDHDVAIVAIAAHEFGHIVQYKSGLIPRFSEPQHKELHADFLSGWFAGRRKLKSNTYPAADFALLAQKSGSFNFQSPKFHGTPEQRGKAVEAGFLAAAKDKLALDDAIERGMTYVGASGGTFTKAPVTSYR